jgi:NTE family protein
MTLERMALFWSTCNRQKIYKIALKKFIRSFLSRRKFNPFMDTAPKKILLKSVLDLDALRKSKTEVIITAVNMRTAELKYFGRETINIEHVMASGAMPFFFPWQFINGEPFWDGGVMANTPIAPALERGAQEIIVVLLSPVGAFRQPLPQNPRHAVELIFEHFLIGSYHALIANLERPNDSHTFTRSKLWPDPFLPDLAAGNPKLITVAPERMLGFRSLLNFSTNQAKQLLREGYICARKQLDRFI